MAGVTAIRQRKQWTADLSTLTDGVAEWTTSGTPSGTITYTVSAISASGTGNAIDGVAFAVSWSNFQNPRYSTLRARFVFSASGPSLSPFINIDLICTGVPEDTATINAFSVDQTLEVNPIPSPEPIQIIASINFNGGYEPGDSDPSISGSLTLTWS
jgi:hypothetical protein